MCINDHQLSKQHPSFHCSTTVLSSEATQVGLTHFMPPATRQLLAHAVFLCFLPFQQFAELKYIQLLNQGHHLEQN